MTEATQAQDQGQTTAAAAKGKVQYATVKMDDGRVVEFAGKRKMLKESIIKDDGALQVRLDFLNGETRLFTLPTSLVAKFAVHGAEQKLGDEIAGLEDVGDCVMAVDELMDRLAKGEWGVTRKPGAGMAGTSVLARALVEHSGKPIDVIKTFLAGKSQAEKVALRQNAAIAPIVARLEAEKTKKVNTNAIDTDALLGGLTGATSASAAEAAPAADAKPSAKAPAKKSA